MSLIFIGVLGGLIAGTPRSYALFARAGSAGDGDQSIVEVEVPAGVEVYSFTFG